MAKSEGRSKSVGKEKWPLDNKLLSRKRNRPLVESAPTYEFIFLNVGGIRHVTTLPTLTKEPDSNLSKWFTEPGMSLPTDASGHFFIDRDGALFGIILSLLRGYQVNIDPSFARLLHTDLQYYGLRLLQNAVFPAIDQNPQFLPGPGVKANRKVLSSGLLVRLCGATWLDSMNHSQTFSILQGPFVGIGIVGEDFLDYSSDFGLSKNCAAYYMDGSVRYNFDRFESVETSSMLRIGDRVTVSLSFSNRSLVWSKDGADLYRVSLDKVCKKMKFKFAAVLKAPAIITIDQG